MLRFTDLLRGNEIVRDVRQKYPDTNEVFERFGVRTSCHDCSIEQAARKAGVAPQDLLAELNSTISKLATANAR